MEKTPINNVSQLRNLNFDLVNYFANTIIPQLFVDADMILRIFTPPAMKQFSLTHNDINRSFHEIKDNIRYPTIIENIEEVISSNNILEKEVQTLDGKWFQMNILPYIEHETGELNGVIITFVDITKRLAALGELEQLNAKHDVLMFALSHDLKQPLTSIMLLSEGMKQAFINRDEEQFYHWLNSLKKATGSITSLVDGFRSDNESAPHHEQELSRVNIQEITQNVIEALRNEIKDNKVTIHKDFQATEIIFPKNNLRSIVYNLVHNSIKFRNKKIPLILNIHTQKSGDHVVLTVGDNGIGMSRDEQKSIFKKSIRLHEDIEGTGMGLYIIKRMLNIHQGDVKVDSTPGKGSVFTVYFKSDFPE